MLGAELRGDSSDRRGRALNSILGVASESVNAAADVLLLPSLILAFFVAELTPSYATIGLVPAIATGFWTLGRLPAFLLAGSRRRQLPWAFAAALVRVAAVAILAVVTSRTEPGGAISVGETAHSHLLSLPDRTLARRGIRQSARVLRFSGHQSQANPGVPLFGSVPSGRRCCVSIGAFVVARLLGTNALSFPSNYGRLFLVATVCLIAVAVFTAAMREPWTAPPSPSAVSMSPRSLRQPLYDSRYRRFLLFRILLSATAAIDPFLFLYAVTRLGAPIAGLGGYVLTAVLGWVVSAPVWFWIERRAGARSVLQGAAVVRLFAPAIALAVPPLAATELVQQRLPDATFLPTIYGVVFFAIGASLAAQSRANHDYLAASTARPVFPLYVGMTNAVLAVVAFAPVLAGILIQRFGYEALFGIAAALGLGAVFAGGWLADTPSLVQNRGTNRARLRGHDRAPSSPDARGRVRFFPSYARAGPASRTARGRGFRELLEVRRQIPHQ